MNHDFKLESSEDQIAEYVCQNCGMIISIPSINNFPPDITNLTAKHNAFRPCDQMLIKLVIDE
jgi:hypothetical protein